MAFSVAQGVRRTSRVSDANQGVGNEGTSPLFLAAIEAVEEALLNSLFMAVDVQGYRGFTVPALPLELIRKMLSSGS